MELDLFDLHCDTAHRMASEHFPLSDNPFAVSLTNARRYRTYKQVMALFTPSKYTNAEGWQYVLQMISILQNDPALQSGKATLFPNPEAPHQSARLYLALEDARVLESSIERIDLLYSLGVRILTPLWSGVTALGGAHNTCIGLSPFGKQAIAHAVTLGMIPDVSHASLQSAEDIFLIGERMKRPVIASHSNAYGVCPVSRNLRDEQILAVIRSNGLIGINLHAPFLSCTHSPTLDDILAHIEYICHLGGADTLCLGCDMDGGQLPMDIPDLSYLTQIAEQLAMHHYSEQLIRGILFDHANSFFQKYISLST